MKELFLRRKPKEILFYLKNRNSANISEIASETNSTYAHSFNLIRELEKIGVVVTTKRGRSKIVTLTEKGRELASLLEEFTELLRGGKPVHGDRKTTTKKISTSAYERLARYHEKLEKISESIEKGNIGSQKSKIKRIAGRYRYLIKKMRPRDERGKRLREASLREIDRILENLS